MLGNISAELQKILGLIYNNYVVPKPPNLIGDRDIEYAFISANIPNGTGKALDFGSGKSNLSLISTLKGYKTTAIDLLPNRFTFKHPDIGFINGDIFKQSFKQNSFNLIINCSSIEHVGLAGRYGVTSQLNDGDIDIMNKLFKILKNGGLMLLTIPVGKDTIVKSSHRIYGKVKLPRLLQNFKIIREVYWIKDTNNKWVITNKQKALSKKTSDHYYNIGCFVLTK